MAVGVNAWNIANPILSNVNPVLLAIHDVVAGDTEVLFDSSVITDKYDRYLIKWYDLRGNITVGLDVIVQMAGVDQVGATDYNYYIVSTGAPAASSSWRLPSILVSTVKRKSSGELILYRGNLTDAKTPSISFNLLHYVGALNVQEESGKGNYIGTVAAEVDGLKFKVNTAGAETINKGVFELYGIPNT